MTNLKKELEERLKKISKETFERVSERVDFEINKLKRETNDRLKDIENNSIKQALSTQKQEFEKMLDEIYFDNPIKFGEEYFEQCKKKGQQGFFYSDFIMVIRDIIVKNLKQKLGEMK